MTKRILKKITCLILVSLFILQSSNFPIFANESDKLNIKDDIIYSDDFGNSDHVDYYDVKNDSLVSSPISMKAARSFNDVNTSINSIEPDSIPIPYEQIHEEAQVDKESEIIKIDLDDENLIISPFQQKIMAEYPNGFLESNKINNDETIYNDEAMNNDETISLFPQEEIEEYTPKLVEAPISRASIMAMAAANPSISARNISKNGVTLDVVYPDSYAWGNRLEIKDVVADKWVDVTNSLYTTNGTYSYGNLQSSVYYMARLTWYSNGWYVKDIFFTTLGNTPSVDIISTTETSVTVKLTYPNETNYGNRVQMQVVKTGFWYLDTPGLTTLYTKSGTYTINRLNPGRQYLIRLSYIKDNAWCDVNKYITLPSAPEVLTRKDGTYVYTNLEKYDTAIFTGANHEKWLNQLDKTYIAMRDFVGAVPYNGAKIEIRTARDLPIDIWAYAGNPIRINQDHFWHQVIKINEYNDWSDCTLHELGHEFTSSRWNFEAEFWAEFMEYYSVCQNNATVNAGVSYYTGSALKNCTLYDDPYQNYSMMLSKGTYLPYAASGLFIKIQEKIGWEPFKQTFKYFNNLDVSLVPSTRINKFNLFLTKLRDFSGVDVISAFSTQEKNIFASEYGGKVEYQIEPIKEKWTNLNIVNSSGQSIGIFISDLDNSEVESKMVILDNTNLEAEELTLQNGKWVQAAQSRAFSTTSDTYSQYKAKFDSKAIEKNVLNTTEELKPYVVDKIAEMYSIKSTAFTSQDYSYITAGISDSITDNLFSDPNPGIIERIRRQLRPTSNKMYARSKMITDAFFVQAYAKLAGYSREETISRVSAVTDSRDFVRATLPIANDSGASPRFIWFLIPAVSLVEALVVAVYAVSVSYMVVATVYSIATFDTSWNHVYENEGLSDLTTEEELGRIAGGYGHGQCKEAAAEMQDFMKKNNKNGAIVTITWVPYNPSDTRFIWSDIKSKEVGNVPIHVGVLFNGKMFCNVHHEGRLTEQQWINDFNYPGIKSVNKIQF